MRVVVVDDDRDMRDLLEIMLRTRHDVTVFSDASIAKDHGDWVHTDAVICDVNMPTEGSHLLDWLNDRHPHIRRVVCTGTDLWALDSAYAALGHDIIIKPFDDRQLEAALDV